MRQNDSERPKIWNLGDFWSCPKFLEIAQKVNECLLGPVTEPNGFKLDMHGPEGSIYPLLRALLEVQKVGFVSTKWLWSPKKKKKLTWYLPNIERSQKGNLMNVHELPWKQIWIEPNGLKSDRMDWIESKSNRIGPNGLAMVQILYLEGIRPMFGLKKSKYSLSEWI